MNSHYKKLRALVAILAGGDDGLDDLIFDAMRDNNTPVSRSQLQGWRVSAGHKNYRRMDQNELLSVIDALIKHFDRGNEQD